MNKPALMHLRLPNRKYCCDGLNAILITPIKTIKEKGVAWRRAVYCCSRCHDYTIRGEAKISTHNTIVNIISKKEAEILIQEKRAFIERMVKKNGRVA